VSEKAPNRIASLLGEDDGEEESKPGIASMLGEDEPDGDEPEGEEAAEAMAAEAGDRVKAAMEKGGAELARAIADCVDAANKG